MAERWQPDPGEHLLARVPVSFATGAATPVSGRRWFRDADRRDIQAKLPGWPTGPTYRVRSKTHRIARGIGRTALALVVIAIAGALGGTGVGSVDVLGRSDDPEDEVEDFPVMWAAPGTLARTLPWQLDPARRPATDRTHAVVTDRRLVILGMLDDDEDPWEEVLWEAKRAEIAAVEHRTFGHGEPDVRLLFVDGSWCRLAPRSSSALVRHFSVAYEPIDPEALTPGQRKAVDAFRERTGTVGAVTVTCRPGGSYLIEAVPSPEASARHGVLTDWQLIGPEGEEVAHEEARV
ncbi:hypothetical protein [Streptomyces sp. R35]|uniref:Uncharacterized protein n=1 Tax=Streptomyces sp. R35 TaxID=3238630 RepID=A0AB39SBP4_9ACTN